MTGREPQRRRRRGETPGGTSSRRANRSDRLRRPTDPVVDGTPEEHPRRANRSARFGTPADPITDDTEGPEEYTRRPSRRRRTPGRGLVSRVLGRLTTRRTALLALVVCALALSVAVPLHTYLSQQDDLRAQQQQQAALRAQQTALERRQAQLADPAEVQAEARTRLHFVMPGDTPYEVQLPAGAPSPGQTGTGQHPGGPTTSWYQKLWNSIVGAH
ncbi:MAG TPA: septum formation initiator family protein [Pseudonocardiaceae bacterium]